MTDYQGAANGRSPLRSGSSRRNFTANNSYTSDARRPRSDDGSRATEQAGSSTSSVNGNTSRTNSSIHEQNRTSTAGPDPNAGILALPQNFPKRATGFGADNPDFSGFFSTRKPRDVGSGMASGVKNIAKGVGLGVAGLFAAPVVGYNEDGFGGFCKGLGAGLLLAVGLPIAGAVTGAVQIARGVYYTPEAIRESLEGKKWDREKREWKNRWYSLKEEHEKVLAEEAEVEREKASMRGGAVSGSSSSSSSSASCTTVKDMEYYDILGVTPDATQPDIRKAYYQLARESHPDKHPGDSTAHRRFQQLGEAYQVLGDEARRADYNQKGKDATNSMEMVDSSLFFMMLFGSEELEPFTGRLRMATLVEGYNDDSEVSRETTERLMRYEQQKREVELALKLKERLRPYVEGDETQRRAWKREMEQQAEKLCTSSFGYAIVEATGWVYENYAKQYLGRGELLGYHRHWQKILQRARGFSQVSRTAMLAVQASIAARNCQTIEERHSKYIKKKEAKATNSSGQQVKSDGEGVDSGAEGNAELSPEDPAIDLEELNYQKEEARRRAETIPLVLATMLQICLFDVEATVRQASKKVLKDMSTPTDERQRCAEALQVLGAAFQKAAANAKPIDEWQPEEMMTRMEEAYVRLAQERDREQHQQETTTATKTTEEGSHNTASEL